MTAKVVWPWLCGGLSPPIVVLIYEVLKAVNHVDLLNLSIK